MRFNEQLINLPHLDQVIDRSPLTINPDSDVVDAIILMNQEQSKSLALTGDRSLFLTPTSHPQVESFVLVVEARQLLGIFSATDVLRLIALGMDIKGVKVAQVMKSPAVTMIYEDGENILTAWSLLQQHRTHYLPILDTAGLLLGVIKETRLLAALDIMKIKALVATLEQNVPPPSNKFPSAHQQIEFIGAQTRNNLRQLEEEQSTELMQFNQEFQQTLEELQVVEEELRQQNEQLLIAHEIAELERQRYRDLFEFAPDGYLVTNTSGIIEEANQAASRLLSIPQQHLIGLPLALFIAPPENLTFASQLRNWQKLQNWEISIQPRQGKAFPASVRVAPVCDAQGEQSGWRWLLCDISQRKQIESALREATDDLEHRIGERTAQLLITNQRLQQEIIERQRVEEALRQSEQLYRQLVECQSELILRADLQGRLIFANQAFCQTFGLKLEEFRVQSVWQFAHPDDLSAILNSIATLANSSCQLSNGEIRAITVNGVRWLQWNVAKIEDETGKVVEIQAVGRDITEQKQTAEALQKSEEKFRHFAENTNVVMWIDDPNTNHNIYVNPAYEKIWGRSCQSLQDKPDSWVEAIHPEDRDRVLSTLEQLKQGQSTDVEYRIIRPDGTLRWIWDRGFVMPGEQEGVHLCGGIAEDITERKQIEESLRESETRLTLALEAGQMGIWDWNLLTGEAVWSDNMPPLYGLPYGSISIGHEEFINLIHPEDRELVLSAEANSMTQGYPHTQEYRVIWPDGSVHWLLAKGQTYYDQDNRAIRMIGVTRDISERQAALHERQLVEKALRESEERYRSVVAALREGIILADAQGNIITCNASAEKILGISSAEIIGHNLYHSDWQTIYEDGSPFHKENYPGIVTLQTGQPCSNVVMGIYLANGKLTWVSMNSQPLFRENESQHYAVVVSFTDMSERKQAEEKILEQAALLDIATNAIFVQDFRNQILFWNKGAERLYGWQSLEVINKSPREIFYSKSIPKLETTALEKVMESGTWQGELNKLNKSGEEIIVESHWTLVRDDAGQPKSIL
ncbi:MAG TPA: PAS domain S-box protein, partial [Nostocaceae cyanobacterium]|nr:PAS domain S-box protein [Nostocaceae cyanobacterium]